MPRRSILALLVSSACVAALALLWFATFQVDFTSWLDSNVLRGFIGLEDTRAKEPAEFAAHSVGPVPFAVMASVFIGIAAVQRRWRLALAVTAILGGANVMTQVLKRLTEGPRAYDVLSGGELLWPSGHTTGVTTLVLCMVLIAPARWRPTLAAAGAVYAVAAVYSIMLLGWHLPSDIVGGALVSTAWTFAALAVLWAVEARWPVAKPSLQPRVGLRAAILPAVIAAAGSVLITAAVVAAEPDEVREHAVQHTTFALGAPLIGAAALALMTAVALVLRR